MTTVLQAIGATPLVRLSRLAPATSADVFLKLEYFNPTGSYKDRMALAMIEAAEARGDLRPGMSVLECTGGSTGSSLAFVCAAKGYRFLVISSDAYAREKLDSMRAFGAELMVEPSVDGQVTPDLWPRMMARADALRADARVYYTNQFHNRDAQAGYAGIGEEIASALPRVDAFCGMVGTAGMLMGVGQVLRRRDPDVRIVALEPSTSAVLSGRPPGSHRVDGTGAGFVPPQFDRGIAGEVRALDEARGRAMAKRLAREEGIFAGTSTGMNVVAALEIAHELGAGRTVVTVACDSGLKYLAGDLFDKE
ncbi:MAG: cysteine synthase family protein [Vicinamibacterales bacterium]